MIRLTLDLLIVGGRANGTQITATPQAVKILGIRVNPCPYNGIRRGAALLAYLVMDV